MNGGTYAKAKEAGFPPQQAAFLARFGGEIRDEATFQAIARIDEKEVARRKAAKDKLRLLAREALVTLFNVVLVLVSALVGYFACIIYG